MGLAVEVGYLADLIENDDEGADSFRDDLAVLNVFLKSMRLPTHQEPEQCEVLSFGMYGYSGIHYLRRIAAHLDLRHVLPPPGGSESSKDEVLQQYYSHADTHETCRFVRLFRRSSSGRTFDHLLLHSDAEGYYLPQDFPEVLFPPKDLKIPGGMIGSSMRLIDECKRLAQALQLPLDIDPEADEVWQACETQGEGDTTWQRYGVESFICLRLYHACEYSLTTGAAIVFC